MEKVKPNDIDVLYIDTVLKFTGILKSILGTIVAKGLVFKLSVNRP